MKAVFIRSDGDHDYLIPEEMLSTFDEANEKFQSNKSSMTEGEYEEICETMEAFSAYMAPIGLEQIRFFI